MMSIQIPELEREKLSPSVPNLLPLICFPVLNCQGIPATINAFRHFTAIAAFQYRIKLKPYVGRHFLKQT